MELNYYADMEYARLSDLLRQANINTENKLMSFSDYCWQDCPDTGKSTIAFILSYLGGPIDHGTHVPVSVA